MNIGQALKASGVNQKMIRYDESFDLLEDVGPSPALSQRAAQGA